MTRTQILDLAQLCAATCAAGCVAWVAACLAELRDKLLRERADWVAGQSVHNGAIGRG